MTGNEKPAQTCRASDKNLPRPLPASKGGQFCFIVGFSNLNAFIIVEYL
jgi:hypothetical protein